MNGDVMSTAALDAVIATIGDVWPEGDDRHLVRELAEERHRQRTDPKNAYRVAIRPDEFGVDDVVIKDVAMFRMERMAEGSFWIACYLDDDSEDRIVFWLTAGKGPFLRCDLTECDGDGPFEEGSMRT